MDLIKFGNGAVYNCPFLSTIPDDGSMRAFIALDGVSFADAARIFSDENMTREMWWGGYRLIGYTQLEGVYVQPYGIQAVLRGGRNERIS